jgi:hypothetical protein
VPQWRLAARGGEFFAVGTGGEVAGSPIAPGGGIGVPICWAIALLCGIKERRRHAAAATMIRIASSPERLHRIRMVRNPLH